jgi:serine/threonine protein kinase
MTMPQHLPLN